ncbi:MAG: DUF1553 domain-containing protein [Planctomycetota bacterium]
MSVASLAAVLLTAVLGAEPASVAPVQPFESPADRTPAGKIDELVFARLKKLGLQPSPLCSDAVFVRRVYLDVIGTLPTAAEAREFLLDRNPVKRRLLIDRLLQRDELADYWAMKWSDLLRIKAEFPINLWPNAAQAYYHWIRTSIRENKPFDRFARELLTSSGINFRIPPVNFYRAIQSRQPTAIAQSVALALMGTRAEKWPQERLAGMSVFFTKIGYKSTTEWKEEIVFFDPNVTSPKDPVKNAGKKVVTDAAKTHVALPAATPPAKPIFPDGTTARIPPDRDPREVFADWLIDAKNPWFARNIVNRTWCWLNGRGIIHEPDDIRPDNPPSNPELLAYLEHELVASHYDLKQINRLILNSKTYQLSSLARGSRPEAETNFAFYPLRRMDAEVLIDAICQVTGTTEKYSSAIPEPYTFLPEGHRSIALPDGSITSPFLETFGRPPRDTGLESERNNRVTASQRLHILNSTHIQRKLEQSPRIQEMLTLGQKSRPLIESLYLTILSRFPTEDEAKIALRYTEAGKKARREAVIDLAWALINSAEFMYRH